MRYTPPRRGVVDSILRNQGDLVGFHVRTHLTNGDIGIYGNYKKNLRLTQSFPFDKPDFMISLFNKGEIAYRRSAARLLGQSGGFCEMAGTALSPDPARAAGGSTTSTRLDDLRWVKGIVETTGRDGLGEKTIRLESTNQT